MGRKITYTFLASHWTRYMPLLTELGWTKDGLCYRHGAPKGAVPPSQHLIRLNVAINPNVEWFAATGVSKPGSIRILLRTGMSARRLSCISIRNSENGRLRTRGTLVAVWYPMDLP